jgi:hypothetical protein
VHGGCGRRRVDPSGVGHGVDPLPSFGRWRADLASGVRIWPVACGSGRWHEDVIPHERDGAVIAIFLFSLFSIIGAHSRSSQVMFVIGDANTWHAYLIWLWACLGWVFLM